MLYQVRLAMSEKHTWNIIKLSTNGYKYQVGGISKQFITTNYTVKINLQKFNS